MLTVLKSGTNGVTSTAGEGNKKGGKGRLELSVTSLDDGTFTVLFQDFGGYGKERWTANFGKLTRDDLTTMVEMLQDVRDGQLDTSHVPFESLVASSSEPVDEQTTAVLDEEEDSVQQTA